MTRYENFMKMNKAELAEYLLGFFFKYDDDTGECYWETPTGHNFEETAREAALEDLITWLEEKL